MSSKPKLSHSRKADKSIVHTSSKSPEKGRSAQIIVLNEAGRAMLKAMAKAADRPLKKPSSATILKFPPSPLDLALAAAAGGEPWAPPEPLEPVRAQLAAFIEDMFKHATAGSYVSLRAFRGDTGKPTSITTVKIGDDNLDALIDAAVDEARKAARDPSKPVFAPPVATFSSRRYATEEKTVDGLDIALELDQHPQRSLDQIVRLLGPPTFVIASGGQWVDPETGEVERKLHAHWRLKTPANGESLELLKDARGYAVDLIAGDATHKPYVHPIRWPGSWHRKGEPKLCLIVAHNPDCEIDLVEAHDILQRAVKGGGDKVDLLYAAGEAQTFKPPLDIDEAFKALDWRGTGKSGNGYATVLSVIASMLSSGEQIDDINERIRDEFTSRYPETEAWDFDKRFRGEFINWFVKHPELLDEQNDPPEWLTKDRRIQKMDREPEFEPPGKDDNQRSVISATPFVWRDPTKIPVRSWLYRPYYIRKFASSTIGHSKGGKTGLIIPEVLSMATLKALLGVQPEMREGKLRVWYWNGEDPMDELDRRFAAVIQHYGLTPEDIGDRLFVDSGRIMPIVIAEDMKSGTKIAVPQVNEVIATMLANKIDVLVIDPFISSHRVAENNNTGIEMVAKSWSRIADATNSSVMLPHHPRKTYGNEVTIEDSRGASALYSAVRATRALNTMSAEEAGQLGIRAEERRDYFRVDGGGGSNLTRSASRADWYKFESVQLGNGSLALGEDGDDVGVVTTWEAPSPVTCINAEVIRKIQAAIANGGPWRADNQSKKELWAGEPFAEAVGVDITLKPIRDWIVKGLRKLVGAGYLKQVNDRDHSRHIRAYIQVGKEPEHDVEIRF